MKVLDCRNLGSGMQFVQAKTCLLLLVINLNMEIFLFQSNNIGLQGVLVLGNNAENPVTDQQIKISYSGVSETGTILR